MNDSNKMQAQMDEQIASAYHDAALEEPPAHLDSVILRSAREATEKPLKPLRTLFDKWRLPVSVAAVLALSVTLVTVLQTQHDVIDLQHDLPGLPPQSATADSIHFSVEQSLGNEELKAQVKKKIEAKDKGFADVATPAGENRVDFNAQPEPLKTLPEIAAKEKSAASAAQLNRASEYRASASSSAQTPEHGWQDAAPVQHRDLRDSAPLAPVIPEIESPVPATSYALPEADAPMHRKQAEIASSAMPGKSAAKHEAASAAMAAASDQSVYSRDQVLRSPKGDFSSGRQRAIGRDALAAYEALAGGESSVTTPPEQWLKQIRAMFESDRAEMAEQELKRFQAEYPDYPKARIRDFLGAFTPEYVLGD